MTDMNPDTRKAVRKALEMSIRWHDEEAQSAEQERCNCSLCKKEREALCLLSADEASQPQMYGGFHLCGRCGKPVTNGEACGRCAEASQRDREAVVWATGFVLGLRQQGMDQWEAWKRVKETAEKWEPSYYAVLKNMERLP